MCPPSEVSQTNGGARSAPIGGSYARTRRYPQKRSRARTLLGQSGTTPSGAKFRIHRCIYAVGPVDPCARYKRRAFLALHVTQTPHGHIILANRTLFRSSGPSIGRADQKVNAVGPSTARFTRGNFYKRAVRISRFVAWSKDSFDEVPTGNSTSTELAAPVPLPRFHRHR